MRAVFGVRMKRKISKDGIRFMGISYNNDALMAERARVGQKEFDVIVDPENLRQISVRRGNETFTVENTVGLTDGITLPSGWPRSTANAKSFVRKIRQAS